MSESIAPAKQKLEVGAVVNFITIDNQVLSCTVRQVEDASKKVIALTGPNHLSVFGVQHDETTTKPETWHFPK